MHDVSLLTDSSLLHRLLEGVTETLAREIASPGTPQPNWQAAEWSLARAVVAMQGIGPLLADHSRWTGGPGWLEFLQGQRHHTAVRHSRLADSAAEIGRGAYKAGISLVALKGLELHRIGLYEVGERPMADIDLLVAAADYPGAVGILERLGFTGGVEGWKDHLFTMGNPVQTRALGEHEENPVKVELHRRIVERLPWHTVALPLQLLPNSSNPGFSGYPSSAALMLHLLLHTAGGMPTRTLRMIQLCDIARLARVMSSRDWQFALQAAQSSKLWWAYPPLALTGRYFEAAIPVAILCAFRERCPGRLARRAQRLRLFDASHSYPWVEAFPGIGWSRTVNERAAYMANRIRPPQAVRHKRNALVISEAWSERHWSERSQWRRIATYLRGSQGRRSTMHAVRLAFESPT